MVISMSFGNNFFVLGSLISSSINPPIFSCPKVTVIESPSFSGKISRFSPLQFLAPFLILFICTLYSSFRDFIIVLFIVGTINVAIIPIIKITAKSSTKVNPFP